MRKLFTYAAAVLLLFLASCAALRHGDMSLISLGMSKEAVIKRIGKPNMVVMAQSTEDGPLEVYEYMTGEVNSYTEKVERRPIWVYFLNNEVIEWGPGEDWQKDAAFTRRMLERYHEHKRNRR
ncbi:DUF3192 domain-containing protein [Sphingobacterium phlebotomi]|uniref:DUF3192 domain-containing protein n=1 Tax=Sphingobacterium phlebotomi TaxID=2605433 RepID=A0A5D4HCZ8_9SPHI|nr:DUF3192 domain-containing protein [Sphingobacterium phlebotomi]TYR38232.1 DUF3192 domain-containing protein [Sphingobacterium phlebotomi]